MTDDAPDKERIAELRNAGFEFAAEVAEARRHAPEIDDDVLDRIGKFESMGWTKNAQHLRDQLEATDEQIDAAILAHL